MKKLFNKNNLATMGGFLTSLGVASVLDWDNFDFKNPAHLAKLFFTLAPSVGGLLSKIKGGKDE